MVKIQSKNKTRKYEAFGVVVEGCQEDTEPILLAGLEQMRRTESEYALERKSSLLLLRS